MIPVEQVEYRGHLIVLTGKARWEVRDYLDGSVYWVGSTIGECQAQIDEVVDDVLAEHDGVTDA
jgi:hypothetical protein